MRTSTPSRSPRKLSPEFAGHSPPGALDPERRSSQLRRMKHAVLCLAGFAVIASPASAAIGDDYPLGIEAVTGFRTDYIHRGFKLADDIFDFQLEAEVALTNNVMLNFGGWFATATGSNSDFEEIAAFGGIRFDSEKLVVGVELTGRDMDGSRYQDSWELSPYLTWKINDNFDITGGMAWDTGADGSYAYTQVGWTETTGSSSFLSAHGGISVVSDWYGESGLNDIYGRLGWTYAINRSVAITPFAGFSIPVENDSQSARLYGGIWFEVNF